MATLYDNDTTSSNTSSPVQVVSYDPADGDVVAFALDLQLNASDEADVYVETNVGGGAVRIYETSVVQGTDLEGLEIGPFPVHGTTTLTVEQTVGASPFTIWYAVYLA